MEETKLSGESMDIVSDNVSKLKEIFPEVICEDKIDFEKLKLILGEDVETDVERYSFTWPGKTQAIKESQKQSTGTLRPCKEESKNWDTTKNLYIEGDNLEVLKLLQKSYYGKIKMIYIDPPYNTGKDFIYKDNYRDNLENYLKISGQVSEENLDSTHTHCVKLSTNTETQGRYHSNWLNMMYPRLKLARSLLTDDGVIFISIDDNELRNLRNICDEIFGETQFIGSLIVKSNPGGRDYGGIAIQHEYILCYSKSPRTELNMVFDNDKKFKYSDARGGFDLRELRNRNVRFNEHNRPNLCYPFYVNEKNIDENGLYEISLTKKEGYIEVMPLKSQGIQTVWRWGKEKSNSNLNINLKAKRKKDNSFMIVEKYRNRFKRERSIWDEKNVRNESGSLLIKDLFSFKLFDYPKSLHTLKRIVSLGANDNDVILDFFSGSSTTAHAILQLNSENNFNLNFIMVQIPEPIDVKSEAYKAGYKNICEIGKERIRRAGDKIVEESGNKDLDIGFKVFKLDSSNLEKWDPDYNNLEQTLLKAQDNIKQDRTQEDLIYELMLDYGVDLTLPIEKHETQKNTIYSLGFGALVICLDDNITHDIADEIIKITEDAEISRVVFKDNGFASDSDKTNIKEILKTNNIDEFITV